ncbi:MAG: FixH family protein [Bacteroidota bacterium]
MKLNWGWGIAIFYTTFVVLMVSMVIRASQNKPDLVTKNYYEKDIRYQEHYDKLRNQKELDQALSVEYLATEGVVEFQFPTDAGTPSGNIHFFRPSNSFQDVHLPIRIDETNKMRVRSDRLPKGLWRVKVDWKAVGKEYFQEETILL